MNSAFLSEQNLENLKGARQKQANTDRRKTMTSESKDQGKQVFKQCVLLLCPFHGEHKTKPAAQTQEGKCGKAMALLHGFQEHGGVLAT